MDPHETKQLETYQKGDELVGGKISVIVGRNDDLMVCTIERPQVGVGVAWRTHEQYTLSEQQRDHLGAFHDRYYLVKKIFRGDDAMVVEQIAVALYRGLCLQNQDPGSIFTAIDATIAAAREEASSRTQAVYGMAAAVTAIVLLPTLFLTASLNMSAGQLLGEVPPAALLVCAAFGTLGALASVLQKLRQLEVPYYPGHFTAALGGCSRILLGSILAVVAFLAAKAGLLLQLVVGAPGGDLLIGILAGVSERLVPDFLESIESRSLSGQEDTGP